MLDFNKVVLADGLMRGLLGQALKEGYLTGTEKSLERRMLESRHKQEALSHLVLFDKILLAPFTAAWKMPRLEESGIVEIIPIGQPFTDPAALLDLTVPTRPFVLTKLMRSSLLRGGDSVWSELSRLTRTPRRKLYDASLDFFLAYFRNDRIAADKNLYWDIFDEDIIEAILTRLTEEHDPDNINMFKVFYMIATAAAEEVKSYQALSAEHQAVVATKEYAGAAGWKDLNKSEKPFSKIKDTLQLLRCAFHDEGLYFPKVQNIEHALTLRKDANLQAFREQLALFNEHVAKGDEKSALLIRKEVSKANQALKQARAWDARLKFVTYFSLPTGLIEAFIGSSIMGLTLTVFSVAATASMSRVTEKHKWVLFGRS